MKIAMLSAALCGAVTFAAGAAFAQTPDEAAVSGGKYPLAAKAGVDSHADQVAPPGAVN